MGTCQVVNRAVIYLETLSYLFPCYFLLRKANLFLYFGKRRAKNGLHTRDAPSNQDSHHDTNCPAPVYGEEVTIVFV